MTAVFQPDDGSIRSRLAQYAAADAYRQQAVSTQEAAGLASFYSAYPNADPGLIAGLVKAGKQPNDPAVQKIMLAHTQQQQHSGFFDKIGDVIGGAASAVGKAAGFVAGSSASGLAALGKGVVRSSLVALETPLQETQDFSRALLYEGLSPFSGGGNLASANRNFGAALQQSGTSSGVEALSKIVSGDFGGIDLGTGFIPGGKIEQTVRDRAGRLQLQLGGNTFGGAGNPAITLGRLVGATVTEPGTQPYNILSGLVDAAAAWFGDPAAALGAAAKEAEVGARISRALPVALDEGLAAGARELAVKPSLVPSAGKATSQGSVITSLLGMIPGHRPTTMPDVTETALSKGGQRIVQHIADETNPQAIYEASNRKIPIAVSNEMAQAGTPQDVLQVLNSHVGSNITSFPEWNGIKVQAMGAPSVRLLGMMPGKVMDPTNLEDVYQQTDRLLRTMKTSPDLRNGILRNVMAAPDSQSVAPIFFDGLAKAADEMAPKLRVGLTQEAGETAEEFAARVAAQQKVKASGLVRSFAADGDKMRAYLGDEIRANDKAAGLAIDGNLIPAQSPFSMLEFLNTVIPMPNARDIRTATATLGRVADNPIAQKTQGLADALMHVWKPLTIIKPALTLRLAGEHQAEMAASGLDSFFSHPLSFVAASLANPVKAQEFMDSQSLAGKLAHPFQTAEALASKAAAPFIGKVRQGDVTGAPFVNERGENALKDLVSGMGNDAQDLAGVAGAQTIRGQKLYTMMDGPTAYSRAWQGSLSDIYRDPVWQKVAESKGNLDDVKRWFWAEGQGYRNDLARRMPLLDTPAGADAYIESLYRGAMYRTGGDGEVLDALSSGKFNGAPVGQLDDKGAWSFSDAFKRKLETVQGPDSVKGPITLSGPHPNASRFDDAMTHLFDHIVQKPFSYLVENPALRQNYWQEAEKMVPFMDAPTRAALLENAAKDGVGAGAAAVKRMEGLPSAASPTLTDLGDVHTLALKRAVDQTKKVLYDQVNKSQFFDAMRTVFPFGEAWRQAFTRWGKIAWNNPNAVVGGQKIVTGLQRNGFFHKDDQGNEVFNMPFGRNISKLELGLTAPLFGGNAQGASVDLTSRASGLSMMSDILPGVGPVLQVGAGAILPNTPDWDWARNFVAPHGTPDMSQGVLESVLPSPVRTLYEGFFRKDNGSQYASYVSDASNNLVATGKYDMTDPTGAEQSRMMHDAQSIAKGMLILHALGQAFAPSSPTLKGLTSVKDGRVLEQAMVAKEFHTWENDPKIGYQGAVQKFIDTYGSQAFLSTQGRTLSLVGNAPLSGVSSDWERSHPDIVKAYPDTWGLFAPQGKPSDFDYSAYKRQMDRGDRVDVTPEQRIALAQIHLASHQYTIAQAQLGPHPTAGQRAALANFHHMLTVAYPAYGQNVVGLPAKVSSAAVIAQLSRAVVDPRLSGTPMAKAASLYLQYRQEGIVAAQSLGASSYTGTALGGQRAAPIRAWLTTIGNNLIQKTPEFGPLFDSVFAREIA